MIFLLYVYIFERLCQGWEEGDHLSTTSFSKWLRLPQPWLGQVKAWNLLPGLPWRAGAQPCGPSSTAFPGTSEEDGTVSRAVRPGTLMHVCAEVTHGGFTCYTTAPAPWLSNLFIIQLEKFYFSSTYVFSYNSRGANGILQIPLFLSLTDYVVEEQRILGII